METTEQSTNWQYSSDPKRAAAAWCARLDGTALTEPEKIELADWLRQSPTHVTEYLRLMGLRDQLRDQSMFDDISLEALCERIRAENVHRLPVEGAAAQSAHGATAHRPGHRLVWAVAAGLAAGLIGWFGWRGADFIGLNVPPVAYATAVGEQRSVVLGDGSIAELNTRSTLMVQFDPSLRKVVLEDGGEALFRVAKDAGRPFVVQSGDTTVRAVGTEFVVRREGEHTTVSVIEGRVDVASSQGHLFARKARHIELAAGQRVAVGPDFRDTSLQTIDPGVALAWKSRRLVFDDLPLERVVREFNRYNVSQILLDPAGVPAGGITGVFDANDPGSFLSFLTGVEAVRVIRDPHGDSLVSSAVPVPAD